MLISAAILANNGELFLPDFLPEDVNKEIQSQADAFTFALKRDETDVELPYYETTYSRYVFRETGDLYWFMVTNTESDLHSDINLLGKLVCTIMEYCPTETSSSSLTNEQINLFYRHIWRVWDRDSDCSQCGTRKSQSKIWDHEFERRVKFLASIRDGQVDEHDVDYFNHLIAESWTINSKLTADRSNESVCSNDTISEEALVDNCRLTCLLEDIRLELDRIQDPYMRLFARRNLLKDTNLIDDNNHFNNISLDDNNEVDDSFDDSSFSH